MASDKALVAMAASDRMIGQRGFATVESLVASVFVSALFTAGIATSYVSFARTWLDRNAYEASICLATDLDRFECEKRFRTSVGSGLPVGTLDHVRISKSDTRVGIEGKWNLGSGLVLPFDDERRLPLRAPE